MAASSLAMQVQQTSKLNHRKFAFGSRQIRRPRAPCRVAWAVHNDSSPSKQLHQEQQQQQHQAVCTRRAAIAAPLGMILLTSAKPAAAFITPPPGYRYHQDKLDGYSFFYPESWLPVTTSGNDVFFRNPSNIEENLFVDVSSPSSSKYSSVEDLGSPQDAAQRLLDQFFDEFMSTRLGIKRAAEVVDASSRTASDGKTYFDIQLRAKSYASRNQLAVSQREVDSAVELEWDRRYLTVLGAANKRLYQFRLQTSTATYEKDEGRLRAILESFQCKEV